MVAVVQNRNETGGLRIIRRRWAGIATVILLFAVGAWLGSYSYRLALQSGGKPMGALLLEFKPAVLFASGRGMIIPEQLDVQQLDAFLAFESATFSPDMLPAEIAGSHLFVSSSNSFALSHWLLFYSIGWCWRIFGISHEALRFLCAFFYGITATALYCLFRLGMGRIFSIAGALVVMVLPPFLCIAPMLRDFSKAPFILMFIAVVGTLLKERCTGRKLAQYGALIGVLVGIGYGFRQDMLICLPVALFTVLAVPLQGDWKFSYRIGALILVAGMFCFTAFPPLMGIRSDSGSVSTHTLFQGLSRQAEQGMEFGDASYELLLRPSDTEVHTVVNAHARLRGCTEPMDFYLSPAYGRLGRQMFLEWAGMFPADLYARGLASLETTTRLSTLASEYYAYKPIADSELARRLTPFYDWYHRCIERFGLFAVVAALFVIAMKNVRLAVAVLLVMGWFMAYPNLLFEMRHAFHLAFVTPWAACFIVVSIPRFLLSVLRTGRCSNPEVLSHIKRRALLACIFIVAIFVGAMVLLAGLRIIQRHNQALLSEAYQTAELEAVETRVEVENHRALVKPAERLPGLRDSWNLLLGDAATEYLVLEFAPSEYAIPVTIVYQPGRGTDFTRQIVIPATATGKGNVRYFFPVYEMANYMPVEFSTLKYRFSNTPLANLLIHHWGTNRFVGVQIYEEDLPRLKAVYRVTDLTDIHWLLYLLNCEGEQPLYSHKRMRVEKEIESLPIEMRLLASKDAEEAVFAYLELLRRFPNHARFAFRAKDLIPRIPDPEKRADALYRLARYKPDWAGRIAIDLAVVGDEYHHKKEYGQAREKYVQALMLSPTDLGYQVKLADTLLAEGESALALECYHSVLLRAPESPYSANQYDVISQEQGATDQPYEFWKQLHATYPDAAVPALHLGRQLERRDLLEEALVLYRHVEDQHPENAEAILRQGILVAFMEGYAKGRVMMDRALEIAPELKPELVAGLTRIATQYTETGAHAFAEAIYREVIELAPDDGWHQVRYGEALMAQENYNKAREVFQDILERTPESPYSAQKLDEIYERANTPEERITMWKSLYELYPKAIIPGLHYGKALERVGDYEEALTQFRILHEAHPDQPEVTLRLGALIAQVQDYDAGRVLMDTALNQEKNLVSLFSASLSRIAEHYFDAGDIVPAERVYRELLQSAADKALIQMRMAEVLTMQERYDEALEFCRILIMADAEASHVASLVDSIYDKKQDAAGCIEEWRTVCVDLPESVLPHIHLGMAYEADNQLENAYGVYAEALRHAPDNPLLKLRYGILVALQEDYDKGRAAMDEAVATSPELKGEMAAGLAEIAAYKKKKEQSKLAEALYREAITLAPDDYWYRVHLGELLLEQERKSEALELFIEVLMARPESPYTATLLDQIYTEQKKEKKRLETWKEIAEKQPDAAVPLYHLGMALESNDMSEEALKAYTNALSIKPDYREAQESVSRLLDTEK